LQIAAQVERARPEWFGAVPGIHVGTVNRGPLRNRIADQENSDGSASQRYRSWRTARWNG
jgi:hypothetical protein